MERLPPRSRAAICGSLSSLDGRACRHVGLGNRPYSVARDCCLICRHDPSTTPLLTNGRGSDQLVPPRHIGPTYRWAKAPPEKVLSTKTLTDLLESWYESEIGGNLHLVFLKTAPEIAAALLPVENWPRSASIPDTTWLTASMT